MSDSSKPKISFKWIIIGILLGAPIVLCGGVGVWWFGRNAVAQAKLDEEIAKLQDRGLPVDDQTMADFHSRLTDDLYTAKWLEVVRVMQGEEFRNRAKALPVLGPDSQLPKLEKRGTDVAGFNPWPDQGKVEQFLTDYSDTVGLINEIAISDRPVRFPIKFESFNTLLDNTQAMREVARVLILEHEVAIRTGDAQREYDAIQSLLGTSIAVRGEPIMVSQLVSVAIHGIAVGAIQKSVRWGNMSPDQLSKILERLEVFEDHKTFLTNALAGERAMALPVFENPGSISDNSAANSLGSRPIDALMYLRLLQKFEDAVTEDLSTLIETSDQLEADFNLQMNSANILARFDGLLTSLVTPAISAYVNAVVRSVMANHLARTGIAVRIFQLQNEQLPNSLSQLSELPFDLSANVALDGNNFGYRTTETGAVLWGYDIQKQTKLQPGSSVPSDPPATDSDGGFGSANEGWVWEFRN